jgi:hypothetical protein
MARPNQEEKRMFTTRYVVMREQSPTYFVEVLNTNVLVEAVACRARHPGSWLYDRVAREHLGAAVDADRFACPDGPVCVEGECVAERTRRAAR